MPSGASHYLVGDVGAGATVLQGEHLSIGFTAEQVRVLIEAATATVPVVWTASGEE